MATVATLPLVTALVLFVSGASALRSLHQAADPPSPLFGGPNVTLDASVQPPAGTSVRLNWRGVGTQNYTSAQDSSYQPGGAVANMYLQNGTRVGGHFFVNNANGGISPAFTRVDQNTGALLGTVVATPIANQTNPRFNNDGGYGSIPTVLLQVTSADGFFQGITYIQRINSLGGRVPGNPLLFTLPAATFPTRTVPNFPLCIPYQSDYLFLQSGTPASG